MFYKRKDDVQGVLPVPNLQALKKSARTGLIHQIGLEILWRVYLP